MLPLQFLLMIKVTTIHKERERERERNRDIICWNIKYKMTMRKSLGNPGFYKPIFL